jgi:hypothetical protein
MDARQTDLARQAFIAEKERIDAALARLVKASQAHFGMRLDNVHWGHVGSIKGIADDLKALCDKVLREGEYSV